MNRRWGCTALVLVAMHWARAAAGQGAMQAGEEAEIGAAGDLQKITIVGLDAERAEALRGALLRDVKILRAGAPSVTVKRFLETVGNGAHEALRSAGYKDAVVRAGMAGESAVLEIKPGERYVSRGLRFETPPKLNLDVLAESLMAGEVETYRSTELAQDSISIALNTSPGIHESKASWQPGRPVRFDEHFLPAAAQLIARAVRRQGHMQCDIDVGYEVDDQQKTAGLKVTVKNLGPGLTLAAVEVRGGGANTQAMVEKYLGIAAGHGADLSVMQGWFDKLLLSGRFAKHTLKLTQMGADKALLTIELEEVEGVPRLDEKLSEADEAMLRYRNWLATFAEQGEELVADGTTAGGGRARMILSPRDGGFFSLGMVFPDKHEEALSFLTSRDAMGIRTTDDRHFFAPATNAPFPLLIYLKVAPHEFAFGAGLRQKTGGAPPVTVQSVILPAGFLSLAHSKDTTCGVKDGVLTIERTGMRCTVDAATGRLREIVAGNLDATKDGMRVALATGKLAEEVARLRAAADRNVYQAGHGLSSMARFVSAAAVRSALVTPGATPEDRAAAGTVMEKLLSGEDLAPLDEWLANQLKEREFDVPSGQEDVAMLLGNDSLISLVAEMVPPLYAYGSWPWTIQRELLLPFDREASAAEWRRLYNDPATGPLACLASAECTAGRNAAVATAFAEMGKRRLTREALQRDLAALLSGDAPMPRWTREMLARFRDLPAADVAALVKVLPTEQGAALAAMYAALQVHRSEPVEKTVGELAGVMFLLIEPLLRERLEHYAPTRPALPQAEIAPPGK